MVIQMPPAAAVDRTIFIQDNLHTLRQSQFISVYLYLYMGILVYVFVVCVCALFIFLQIKFFHITADCCVFILLHIKLLNILYKRGRVCLSVCLSVATIYCIYSIYNIYTKLIDPTKQ
jgi:uncharacterized membrane protein